MKAATIQLVGLMLVQVIWATSVKQSLRILALFPHSGKSHWQVYEPIFEELAKRGNNVTVVGHFPRQIPIENYHDISIAGDANMSVNVMDMNVMGSNSYFASMLGLFHRGAEEICRKGLKHPNVQSLIRSHEKFDVIVTEIFNADCFLGFVYKFKTPFVGLRSAAASPWMDDRVSNPDNPSYIPNSLTGKKSRMDFWDRLENLLGTLFYKMFHRCWDHLVYTEIAREHFGEEMPPLEEIAMQTSLIMTNTHFAHYLARPLVPGLREIGGVHIKENKPLPEELENWISGAQHGAVYFSLGSMLRTESLSSIKRKAFFDAFAALPQRVLMKWESNQTEGVPANVKTIKWSPQFDVISHPNVKVFIYHGGMLGITEAVYAGTPMVLIPVFGDQPTNAALLQEKGLAVVLRLSDLTKKTLLAALRKVLHEPSYQETASRMSSVIRDRLVSPLDEAVYWIEYVGRHNGAPWLRTPAHGMPLYQYLLLDVIGFIILTLLFMCFGTWLMFKRLVSPLFRRTGASLQDCYRYTKIKTKTNQD